MPEQVIIAGSRQSMLASQSTLGLFSRLFTPFLSKVVSIVVIHHGRQLGEGYWDGFPSLLCYQMLSLQYYLYLSTYLAF